MTTFKKILVANRSEIAIRVFRAANEMGKGTVAVFAEEDKLRLHRFKADEAYQIGEGLGPVEAYLTIPEIIRVAKSPARTRSTRATGFLAENPDFVDACAERDRASSGRRPRRCASSATRRARARWRSRPGCRSIPATEVLPDDMAEVARMAEEIGYPVHAQGELGRRRARDAADHAAGGIGG